VTQAFFIAQGDHARLDAEGRKALFGEMDLIVCNPGLGDGYIAAIREYAKPGARLLAYDNLTIWQATTYDGPYWQAKQAAVKPVLYTEALVPGYPYPFYRLDAQTAHRLAAFHESVTMTKGAPGHDGFDGLYFDDNHHRMPAHKYEILRDVIGARKAKEFHLDWIEGKLVLTSVLRNRLDPGTILIANTGGGSVDPNLNGITLEGVGDRFPTVQALGMFMSHRTNNPHEPIGVCWKTTHESEAMSDAVASIPWIHTGTMHQDEDEEPVEEAPTPVKE